MIQEPTPNLRIFPGSNMSGIPTNPAKAYDLQIRLANLSGRPGAEKGWAL